MKEFGVGISGLVGSRIQELLSPHHEFTNLSLDTGVNITDPSTLKVIEEDTSHPVVIHLAAKADVDGCEKDKELGEQGDAWKINVLGTKNVVEACKKTQKKIVYISTDFVFDGNSTPEGGYTEEDLPNPINWYAHTKHEGEKIVTSSGLPFLIVRIAYPYRKEFALKNDLVKAMRTRLESKQILKAVTDHIMTPTFIDDIAYALDFLIKSDATGIYHVVGSQFVSPFDVAHLIAQTFSLDSSFIQKTTRAEYFSGKAPRPFNLAMNNGKIIQLGIKMKTFEEGLRQIRNT